MGFSFWLHVFGSSFGGWGKKITQDPLRKFFHIAVGRSFLFHVRIVSACLLWILCRVLKRMVSLEWFFLPHRVRLQCYRGSVRHYFSNEGCFSFDKFYCTRKALFVGIKIRAKPRSSTHFKHTITLGLDTIRWRQWCPPPVWFDLLAKSVSFSPSFSLHQQNKTFEPNIHPHTEPDIRASLNSIHLFRAARSLSILFLLNIHTRVIHSLGDVTTHETTLTNIAQAASAESLENFLHKTHTRFRFRPGRFPSFLAPCKNKPHAPPQCHPIRWKTRR